MRRIIPLGLLAVAACVETVSPAPQQPGSPTLSAGATHTEGSFFATAACADDLGYNIRFGGQRVLVRHVSGTDTTLSFRVQEFQGWRLPETTFDQSTVDYDVLGGAEMFNIKRDADGTLDVRIHEGTLVFSSLSGDQKIVARHVIHTVPGAGTTVNQWNCRLTGRG